MCALLTLYTTINIVECRSVGRIASVDMSNYGSERIRNESPDESVKIANGPSLSVSNPPCEGDWCCALVLQNPRGRPISVAREHFNARINTAIDVF